MNPVGIMQGRLSPPTAGRIQSFPVDTWKNEFYLARKAGLDCIEWIYEVETEDDNPLRTDEGIEEIYCLVGDSGTRIRSICADYYMVDRLVKHDGEPNKVAVRHLEWLMERAQRLAIQYIVLPFVDNSSIQSPQEMKGLVEVLHSLIPVAMRLNVELHLETDFKPADLVSVLERVSHPLLRANYDTGNSASLGFKPEEELVLLKPWLGSVHIKDRVLGGGTVPLGTGDTDLPSCFRLIRAAGFHGFFILQAAREDDLSEVELARKNRGFVEGQLELVAAKEE
jgi:L-ribulose-5-phosphate 3-epimerase